MMKGFYITIKNGLLDPKHFEKMKGEDTGTIWLFLWLLDKMTIVDEEKGEGKVLGGRPVKFEEFQKEIPVSQRTYQRWTKRLRNENYIKTQRTPYGLIFVIYKAFKVFGQKVDKNRKVFKDASVCRGEDASNNNNTVTNKPISKDIGLAKPIRPKRKDITFPKDTYNKILDTYQKSKGITLKGTEFDPVMQTIKSMLMCERKPEEIIACIQWFQKMSESDKKEFVWTRNWTIKTIRLKIAEFLAGKLDEKTGGGIKYPTLKEIEAVRNKT